MRQLFKSDELSIAYVDSVQTETGMVVLKFPRRMAPRLKVQKSITVIKKSARQILGNHPTEWTCHWEEFCENPDYHSSASDVVPMYYVQCKNDGYDYVACSGISTRLYDLFVKTTSEGKSLSVIVYNPFPPVDYYKNLSRYMDVFSDNKELMLEPLIDYEDWRPEELAYDENNPSNISDTILKTLDEQDSVIVQGPPGTGKSYNIATIIASYLENGHNVCVTTMANKGLVELIKQRPLEKYIPAGKISKTNLSIDEQKQIGGVKNAGSDLLVPDGELLCATNYGLSSVFSENKMKLNGLPSYDLIVIEEASQAFLTTIAAFKQLGNKCLIVGDPMQLPPIVKLNNPLYNAWNVNTQIEGLKTFALGSNIKAYRIVTTFRLTDKSAALTKIFYGNKFISVKKEYQDFSEAGSSLFSNEGGVLFTCTNDLKDGLYSDTANNIIRLVVDTMQKKYPERSLAIITPFRDTVKELQKRFSLADMDLDITIETIDRIQGMTVDYAILYIPGRNPGFALEERRFNVATSRSRSTTLIISDMPLQHFHSVSPNVIQFIKQCDTVDNNYKVVSSQVVVDKPEKDVQPILESSTVKTDNIKVKVVGNIDLSKFERTKKELQPEKKNYYIIDTNVFVNFPNIISRIDKKYPIILSAKVTDELDKLKIKLTEQNKQNAEKALRFLNNVDSHEIIYEFADVSLLPNDFDKRSPDNMILSVALKYKEENPIMLTSDNGLQLKSKILGITTISLKNFLKR
ncbi:PIN domain-containing protein [Plebeiibacterium marinum]|uniref:PIN domain-containing protein n=1 Tax=Plebeiibacterium marinum TaxID=2992111 RepID=A0AAE3MDR4_9BACT|nr:PIN domain-containing protein [Plebeiobacterium marinum]MCW3805725.1 PIN domain-containing protein [Plebeiobacterium marinum]